MYTKKSLLRIKSLTFKRSKCWWLRMLLRGEWTIFNPNSTLCKMVCIVTMYKRAVQKMLWVYYEGERTYFPYIHISAAPYFHVGRSKCKCRELSSKARILRIFLIIEILNLFECLPFCKRIIIELFRWVYQEFIRR